MNTETETLLTNALHDINRAASSKDIPHLSRIALNAAFCKIENAIKAYLEASK